MLRGLPPELGPSNVMGNGDSVARLGQPRTRPEWHRPIVTSFVSPRVPAPCTAHLPARRGHMAVLLMNG